MRLLLGVLTLSFSFIAMAETAYVTDNLRLSVYATADFGGSAIRTLESGQEFEVLSRDRLAAHVELPDGQQGYVRAAYIVYDKPAKLIVAETAAERDRLAQELADLRESFAEPAALVERLEAESADLKSQLANTQREAADLEEANADLISSQAAYKHSLPYTWVGGAILVCLVGGFLFGLWWVDRQNRRRHGGIRVY